MKISELLLEKLPPSDWIFPDGTMYLSDHFFDQRDERIPELSQARVQALMIATADLAGPWIRSLGDTRFVVITQDGYKIPVVKSELPESPGEYQYVAMTILSPGMKLDPREVQVKIPLDL